MAYYIEEAAWKCPKHPSKKRRTTTGVCSICLRDRLSELCPHCANMRPCSSNCAAASTTSLSSSSGKINGEEPAFSRSKSVGIPFLKSLNINSSSRKNQPESEKCSKIGDGSKMELCRSKSVGIPFLKSRNVDSSSRKKQPESEKSNKIGNDDGIETELCRSKSVGIPFLKSRTVNSGDRRKTTESEKSNKTTSFWWIFKLRKREKENESESKAYQCNDTRIKEFAMTTVMRSKSVNVAMTSVSGENDVNYSPEKLKGWYLVSPMKVFRQSSRAPKLVN